MEDEVMKRKALVLKSTIQMMCILIKHENMFPQKMYAKIIFCCKIRRLSVSPFVGHQAEFPYEWQPHVVSCSVARLGGLLVAAVPGEFTTMAGRRLRAVVGRAGGTRAVIAGLSNVYSDYITTPEEYQVF